MIEQLMGGGGGGYSQPYAQNSPGGDLIAQRPMETDLSLDSITAGMPSFNPLAHLQKKAAMQQRQSGAPVNEGIPMQQQQSQGQAMPSYQYLKEMMQDIAKDVSEKIMRNVLKEYSENYSNKKYFEVYNKENNIIKTPDGKFYKLTPVVPKRKNEL